VCEGGGPTDSSRRNNHIIAELAKI
jgi:hypothetical protein